MKKLKLRMWVKVVLVSLVFIGLGTCIAKMNDDFMKGCMSNGYSKEYCIAHR